MVVNAKKALDSIKDQAFKIKGFKEHYDKVVKEVLETDNLMQILTELDFSGPQIMIVLELLILADETAKDDNSFLESYSPPTSESPKASC